MMWGVIVTQIEGFDDLCVTRTELTVTGERLACQTAGEKRTQR
jgi:hypothetical protein